MAGILAGIGAIASIFVSLLSVIGSIAVIAYAFTIIVESKQNIKRMREEKRRRREAIRRMYDEKVGCDY